VCVCAYGGVITCEQAGRKRRATRSEASKQPSSESSETVQHCARETVRLSRDCPTQQRLSSRESARTCKILQEHARTSQNTTTVTEMVASPPEGTIPLQRNCRSQAISAK
jgi:hypothetical protein